MSQQNDPKKLPHEFLNLAVMALAIFGGLAAVVSCVVAFITFVSPSTVQRVIVEFYPQPTQTPRVIIVTVVTSPQPQPTSTFAPTITPIPSPVPSSFGEEFESPSLSESLWEVSGPPPGLENGLIYLKSNLSVFPYIYTKANPFPAQGNFFLEVSFRYRGISERGVGFVVDNVIPQVGSGGDQNAFLYFWQDSRLPLSIFFMGTRVYAAEGSDLSSHILRLQYDGKYNIFVDDKLVYTSPAIDERPSTVWFGNPSQLGSDSEWTSFELDYIRIKSMP